MGAGRLALPRIRQKEEGGRHSPFFQNYRPQFYFRTTDVTGQITLPEGTEMVMPGDNTCVSNVWPEGDRRVMTTEFVGRDLELVVLHECLEAALEGHTRLVLCQGQAGIGKTRLVEELMARRTARVS